MESNPEQTRSEDWYLPVSALNHFLFCPRRAALIHVEGIFEDNVHTVIGDLVHEHADLPGYEIAKGVKLLRALPVFSDRLGLSGKCDIVEQDAAGELSPVEYKKGPRRKFINDDAQLCAQALCLEEMFGKAVPRGAVFHAANKRRRCVEFTPQLRAATEEAIAALHLLVEAGNIPQAIYKPACEGCSLYEICLPKLTSRPSGLEQAKQRLFQT
jgi:CRISPR-associated exonuclease Cas4